MNAEDAFIPSQDREHFFASSVADVALVRLQHGLEHERPVTVLTGEAGVGKTCVVREACARWGVRVRAEWLVAPEAEPDRLLAHVVRLFGGNARGDDSRRGWLVALSRTLGILSEQDELPLLIVEDAHALSDAMLGELGAIHRAAAEANRKLRTILLGRPELEKRLDDLAVDGLTQFVGARLQMPPLPVQDVRHYLHHRIVSAGSDTEPVFSRKAARELHAASGGVPAVLDRLAMEAVRAASNAGTTLVGQEHVRAVVAAARPAQAAPASKASAAGAPGAKTPSGPAVRSATPSGSIAKPPTPSGSSARPPAHAAPPAKQPTPSGSMPRPPALPASGVKRQTPSGSMPRPSAHAAPHAKQSTPSGSIPKPPALPPSGTKRTTPSGSMPKPAAHAAPPLAPKPAPAKSAAPAPKPAPPEPPAPPPSVEPVAPVASTEPTRQTDPSVPGSPGEAEAPSSQPPLDSDHPRVKAWVSRFTEEDIPPRFGTRDELPPLTEPDALPSFDESGTTAVPPPAPRREPEPEVARVAPAEPEPAAADAIEPQPVSLEPEPVLVEPAALEPEPIVLEPEPVVLKPDAVVPLPEPVAPAAAARRREEARVGKKKRRQRERAAAAARPEPAREPVLAGPPPAGSRRRTPFFDDTATEDPPTVTITPAPPPERNPAAPQAPTRGVFMHVIVPGVLMVSVATIAIFAGTRGGFERDNPRTPARASSVAPGTLSRAPAAVPQPQVAATPQPTSAPQSTLVAQPAPTPPAESALAPSKPAKAAPARFCLVVGTYLFSDRARIVCRHLERRTNMEAWVDTAEADGTRTYRIMLGSFATEAQAEKYADKLLGRAIVSEAMVLPVPADHAQQ